MFEATRARFTFAGEWMTAAAFFAATLLIGVLIVRELRGAPTRLLTDAASATVGVASAAVPPDAVSVPSLVLGTHDIRVGDLRSDALARLDPSVKVVRQSEERGPLGPRETRMLQLGGTSFILVFEPFERRGESRVAAIYLQ
ncbi:MAG: hypothetical protein LAO77_24700 [Acidobacteriia bacterium]|nr:hypothetical protein [Terriglobia bacterium]